jgi:hypothetical protein
MQTVKIYGSSDDLIEISGVIGGDEFYIGENDQSIFVLGGKMQITAIFGRNGCWHFAVGQVNEDIPLPSWPMSIRQHMNGYSVELTIEVPDDVSIFERKV